MSLAPCTENSLLLKILQVIGLLLPNQTFKQMIFWQVSIFDYTLSFVCVLMLTVLSSGNTVLIRMHIISAGYGCDG